MPTHPHLVLIDEHFDGEFWCCSCSLLHYHRWAWTARWCRFVSWILERRTA